MNKSILIPSALLTCAALSFAGNPQSPSAQASVTIAGKSITIKYSAPSLRGRKMFGPDGQISKDPTYPAWRTGADDATALHTDADLMIGSLNVPKGDYTIYTLVNNMPWQLIINKQTKQWGTDYDAKQDLGRVPMTMSKPSAPIEIFKITLSSAAGNKGKLQLEWENVIASVPFTVK
jgi:hypothetical protein